MKEVHQQTNVGASGRVIGYVNLKCYVKEEEMTKKLSLLAVMLFAMVAFTSSTWAFDANDHVTIAPNNQGDLLSYPLYAAIPGGFETKFTVVNTSNEYSTVAKVVVRSEKYSEELLDFMIFLSPKDMWTGYLRYDADKGPIAYSEDDSVLASPEVFASEDNPFESALVTPACDDDTNQLGYVTVLNVASTNGSVDLDGDTIDLSKRPVDKLAILEWYNDLGDAGTSLAEEDLPQNIIAGWMDFNIVDLALTSAIRPVTFKDYGNLVQQTIFRETILGDFARNTLGELEAALAKTQVGMPYLNNEDINLHWFTFPTKYADTDRDCEVVDALGPFFGDLSGFEVPVNVAIYDTEENKDTPPGQIVSPPVDRDDTTFNGELNWLVSTVAPFEEGWLEYAFSQSTQAPTADGIDMITYTGAPVIPVNMKLGANGLALSGASWSNGDVTSSMAGSLVDYQVTDEN